MKEPELLEPSTVKRDMFPGIGSQYVEKEKNPKHKKKPNKNRAHRKAARKSKQTNRRKSR